MHKPTRPPFQQRQNRRDCRMRGRIQQQAACQRNAQGLSRPRVCGEWLGRGTVNQRVKAGHMAQGEACKRARKSPVFARFQLAEGAINGAVKRTAQNRHRVQQLHGSAPRLHPWSICLRLLEIGPPGLSPRDCGVLSCG